MFLSPFLSPRRFERSSEYASKRFVRRAAQTICAICVVCGLLSIFPTFRTSAASSAFANDAELKAIDARAAEIAPLLTDDGVSTVGKLADRAGWKRLAALPSGKSIVARAENYLKEKSPTITEELYKEFYRNGNRSHYQGAFFRLQNRVETFALAEALENEGRFVDALDADLKRFCALPSWVLPAHDSNAVVYDGKSIHSDLGATVAAGNLAIATTWLAEKLPAETVSLVRENIERRVLAPYEAAVAADKTPNGMWWVRGGNNWNAVCHAGTVAAALYAVESRERRAKFVAAADFFSERDFVANGFSNDGYCSEGMGYWDYGFGYYLYLGALVREATAGRVDFFRFPKIRAILDYAPTLELDKGNFVAFADCSLSARPSPLYVGYLSRLKGFGYLGYERRGLGGNFSLGDCVQTAAFGFDADVVFPANADNSDNSDNSDSDNSGASDAAALVDPPLPIRTEFVDAGVWICRPNSDATGLYFAIACKGGHNNELHNHNDVGSYSLILGTNADAKAPDVFVCRDPGGETYTARTFSARRYEGELLNSFGHPVPRVSGALQKSGGAAKAVVVRKSFSDAVDEIELELSSAYPVDGLESLRRTFRFERATGKASGGATVSDSVRFADGKSGEFETAAVTFEKFEVVERTETTIRLKIGNAELSATATDAAGNAVPLRFEPKTIGENDPNVPTPTKPTRLTFALPEKTAAATITLTYSAK